MTARLEHLERVRHRRKLWRNVQGWALVAALICLAPIVIAILIPLVIVAGALLALLYPPTWIALIVATAAVLIFG